MQHTWQQMIYRLDKCWATNRSCNKFTHTQKKLRKSQFMLLFYLIIFSQYLNLKYYYSCMVILYMRHKYRIFKKHHTEDEKRIRSYSKTNVEYMDINRRTYTWDVLSSTWQELGQSFWQHTTDVTILVIFFKSVSFVQISCNTHNMCYFMYMYNFY